MAHFQPYLFRPTESEVGFSIRGLLFELGTLRNSGNTATIARKINGLVEHMGVLMGKQGKGSNGKAGLESFHFVNVSVTADDWPIVVAEYAETERVLESLGALVLAGYKVSFSANFQNGLTVASLTDKREGSPTFGACLTGSADGWYDAFRVLLYKFECVLKTDLSMASGSQEGMIRIQ